jgi:hypothetical protein
MLGLSRVQTEEKPIWTASLLYSKRLRLASRANLTHHKLDGVR